jgi:hypothetical protein
MKKGQRKSKKNSPKNRKKCFWRYFCRWWRINKFCISNIFLTEKVENRGGILKGLAAPAWVAKKTRFFHFFAIVGFF